MNFDIIVEIEIKVDHVLVENVAHNIVGMYDFPAEECEKSSYIDTCGNLRVFVRRFCHVQALKMRCNARAICAYLEYEHSRAIRGYCEKRTQVLHSLYDVAHVLQLR